VAGEASTTPARDDPHPIYALASGPERKRLLTCRRSRRARLVVGSRRATLTARRDVLIHAEEVVGVVAVLELDWAAELLPADPAESEAHIEWTFGLWEAMRRHSAGGAYVNLLGQAGGNRVRAAY
jgi:hypothetical protein